MALKVGELFASFNLDTSGVDSAVSSAEQRMAGLGKGLTLGGAAMTAAVTAPLLGAAKQIFEAGSGFDAQMSKVFAIAGDSVTGSAEAMASLRAKALEMGSTTQFTASEAGQAMEYMAMAGWKTEEMLAAIGPLMNLAAAAGEDLGTTSDIVTDAMTAFGLSANGVTKIMQNGVEVEVNNVTHFADVLAAISANANTNVSMLGESFKYCGAIAGTMGYSIEDTAIALGIMANSGIKASQAGTSLRRIMTSLNGDIEIEGKALGKVTIRTTNADGTMRSFSDILADCRKAFDGLTDSEKASAAKALVGQNAMSAFLTLMNASDEELAALTGAVYGCNGAAEKMAKTMLDNAKGDITLFQSALEGLEVTLWGLAEGGFRQVVQKATGVVDSFRTMDSATQAGTLRIAALAAAAGPVMTGLGGLITMLPKLAGIFTAVSGPTALLALGMVALGAAAIDSDNTIGKTLEKAIPSLGKKIAAMGKTWQKNVFRLQANANTFLSSLKKAIETGVPDIVGGIGNMAGALLAALAGTMPKAGNVARTLVTSIAEGIKSSMGTIVPAAVSLMKNLAAALVMNGPTVIEAMAGVLVSLAEELAKVDWAGVGTSLNTALQTSLEELGTWFKKLAMGDNYTENASWEQVGTALAESVQKGIATALGKSRDFIGGLILGKDYSPKDDWATFGEKIINKVFDGADGAVGGAADFVGGILDGIAGIFTDEAMTNASGTLAGIAGTLIDHIFAEIPKLADKAGTLLEKIAALILGDENSSGLAANVLDGAAQLAEAIFTAIAAGMENGDGTGAVNRLLDVLGNAFSEENISRITSSLQGLISAVFTGMTAVLPQFADQAGEVISGIIDLMFKNDEDGASLFGSALTSAQTLVSTLIRSIVDFIPQAASTATNLLGALLDTLFAPQGENGEEKSLAQDALDSVRELVSTVVASVPGLIGAMGSSAAQILTAIGEALFGKGENEGAVSLGVKALTDIVTNIFGAVSDDVIPGLGSEIGKILTAVAQFFTPGKMGELGAGLGDLAAALLGGIVDTLVAAVDAILAIGDETDADDMFKGILEGINSFAGKVIEALADAIPKIVGAGGKILGRLAEIFSPENIGGMITEAQSVARGLMDTIMEAFTGEKDEADRADLLDAFTKIVSNIVTGIVEALPHAWKAGEQAVSAGFGIAAELLRSITEGFSGGGLDIDLGSLATSFIGSLTGVLGSALDFGGELVDAGTKIAGSLLDSLSGAFETEIGAEGVSAVGEKLRTVAQKIITGITTLLPRLFEAGGKAVSAGVKLASELVKSLAEGFGSGSFGADFAGMAQGIVNGITEAVSNLPALLENVLSAGAQIANAIMGSIVDALTQTEQSGAAVQLGEAAGALVSSLLTTLTSDDFKADAETLLSNIGAAITSALASLGDIAGQIIGTILSPEGMSRIAEAGVWIGEQICNGITSVLGGLGTFFVHLIDNTLIAMGVIDKKTYEEYQSATRAQESYVSDVKNLFNEALTGGSNEGLLLTALFGSASYDFLYDIDWDSIPEGMRAAVSGAGDVWNTIFHMNEEDRTAEAVRNVFENAFREAGLEDYDFSGDLWENVFQAIADTYNDNLGTIEGSNSIWEAFLLAMLGKPGTEGVEAEAAEAAEATAEAVAEAAGDAADGMRTEFGNAMDRAGSEGLNGFTGALAEGAGPATAAALSITDDVVRVFLLTMSAENGAAIGEQFTGGIMAVLNDGTLVAAAAVLGNDTYKTLAAILAESSGSAIGNNFGQGLANGITAMTGAVQSAAWNLGITAAEALSAAIQEGSPSKVTAESGVNFGLGFINSVLDSAEDAGMAAAQMGRNAADALSGTVGRMRNEASEQMSVPLNKTGGGEFSYGAERTSDAEEVAMAVAKALNGATIVMSEERVGELVFPTVSELIATNSDAKRWGTE